MTATLHCRYAIRYAAAPGAELYWRRDGDDLDELRFARLFDCLSRAREFADARPGAEVVRVIANMYGREVVDG